MTPAQASAQFQASLAGGTRPEQTYDLASFKALSEADKASAINTLLTQVKQLNDARAMETLGFSSDRTLVSQIQPWTELAPGPMRSAARRATVRLAPSPSAIKALEEDMAEYPTPVQSAFSAALLAELQEATAAQLEVLYNPNDLARFHAYNGLVEHFSLAQEAGEFFGRIRCLLNLLNTDLATAWREGADGLTAIFSALQSGADPASLNLGYTPGTHGGTVPQILAVLNDCQAPPYDTDAMRLLDGDDQAWLRAQLVARMNKNKDLRALRALPVVQPVGWRTFVKEEEANQTAALEGAGDSPWLKEVRALLAQTP